MAPVRTVSYVLVLAALFALDFAASASVLHSLPAFGSRKLSPREARRIITNDFEGGVMHPWYDTSPGDVKWSIEDFGKPIWNYSAPQPNSGTKYLRAKPDTTSSFGLAVLRSLEWLALPGDRIYVSFWIRSKYASENTLEVYWLNGTEEVRLMSLSQFSSINNLEWRTASAVLPITTETITSLIIYGYCGSNPESAIALDNMKLIGADVSSTTVVATTISQTPTSSVTSSYEETTSQSTITTESVTISTVGTTEANTVPDTTRVDTTEETTTQQTTTGPITISTVSSTETDVVSDTTRVDITEEITTEQTTTVVTTVEDSTTVTEASTTTAGEEVTTTTEAATTATEETTSTTQDPTTTTTTTTQGPTTTEQAIVNCPISLGNDRIPCQVIAGICYCFSTYLDTWYNAEASCQNAAAPMKLLSVESLKEQNDIAEFLKSSTSLPAAPHYWNSAKNVGGVWSWAATGKPLEYVNWGPLQPGVANQEETCGRMRRDWDYQWESKTCWFTSYFICESN